MKFYRTGGLPCAVWNPARDRAWFSFEGSREIEVTDPDVIAVLRKYGYPCDEDVNVGVTQEEVSESEVVFEADVGDSPSIEGLIKKPGIITPTMIGNLKKDELLELALKRWGVKVEVLKDDGKARPWTSILKDVRDLANKEAGEDGGQL